MAGWLRSHPIQVCFRGRPRPSLLRGQSNITFFKYNSYIELDSPEAINVCNLNRRTKNINAIQKYCFFSPRFWTSKLILNFDFRSRLHCPKSHLAFPWGPTGGAMPAIPENPPALLKEQLKKESADPLPKLKKNDAKDNKLGLLQILQKVTKLKTM